MVLGQAGVPDKTNAIGAADELLLALGFEGRVVTVATVLTQQEIVRTILASRGDYLIVVKDNQVPLHADIVATFRQTPTRWG